MENQETNPAVWFEIYVEDMDRAAKFYKDVLHVNLRDMADPNDPSVLMKAFPSKGESFGASGALVKMDGMKSGGSGTLIYFSCQDCAVEEDRVVKAGGSIFQYKMSLGDHGFCSIMTDTEGNNIGLHSLK